MAEWLVERGVGEERALLVDRGAVIAARLRWPGEVVAGQRLALRLAAKTAGARRGLARDEAGSEFLVDRLPSDITEGQCFPARVTRAPVAERGRLKRAQARFDSGETGAAPGDHFAQARTVQRFPEGLWEDLWESAAAGEVAFPGGSILLSPTPAMTLVDIDGALPPRQLAAAAVPVIAAALRQFDIGGAVGIDFPTLEAKADRRLVDEMLDAALGDWPHERTAMNGFGFVHLVARLEGPSLLHRLAFRRADAAARMALRRAERVEGAGATLLSVNPLLVPRLVPEWLAEVERRTGRSLRIASDPGLAITAAHAQIVPL